jgi:hypothetical protein
MKLLLIDTRPSYVIFCDYDKASYIKRKTCGTYGRIYFTYKRSKIYLDEFIPQPDGSEIYCNR